MNAIELLKTQSDILFKELCDAIEGVDEPLSWAVVPMKEGEFLHSNGSILTIVQHIACCKRMYASSAFRNGELRWRDCAEIYDDIGSDWARTIEDLHDAHGYWTESWAGLAEEALDQIRSRPQGGDLPLWRLLGVVIHHDAYHGGQIEVLKVSVDPSSTPPPSTGDDIREYCKDLPFW